MNPPETAAASGVANGIFDVSLRSPAWNRRRQYKRGEVFEDDPGWRTNLSSSGVGRRAMNPAGQVEIHTAKNFFSNIDSRTVLDFDFQHGSSFRRETDALIFTLSRGLESTNRRFVLRRPDHFPNGVVSTIFQSAISLRDCDSQETHAF